MAATLSISLRQSLFPSLSRWLLLACLFTLTVSTARAQVESAVPMAAAVTVVPSRPLDHILDDSRFLDVDEREQVQRELSRRFIEQQVDVYLVILDTKPAQGDKAFAREAGLKWSRAPMWCVVFCVLGDPAGILVEAGGTEIPQPEVDYAVVDSVKRARRENGVKAQLLAACRECPNDLRFLLASHNLSIDESVKQSDKVISARTRKIKMIKLLAIIAGILMIIGAAVIFILVRKIKFRRKNFVFPETVWRERFLGPHSGGSGVVINYRK